jgi:hypothetical protein
MIKTTPELINSTWYLSSDKKKARWPYISPVKKSLLLPYTSVFLSADIKQALIQGKHLAVTSLKPETRLLNTVTDYEGSEKLRTVARKNLLLSRSHNVEHDFWHEGWRSGDVLKFAWDDDSLDQHFHQQVSRDAEQYDFHPSRMMEIFIQNLSRGLTEHLCQCAQHLGYDGLYGMQHGIYEGYLMPFMAIWHERTITQPEWIKIH